MPYIEITRDTFLSAQPARVGEVYEVTDDVASLAVGAKCAKIVEQPDEVIIPPKPSKPRKVTKKATKKEGEEETDKKD